MSKLLFLSQIIALNDATKSRVVSATDALYKLLQKPTLFNGQKREYKPIDDNDKEVLPSENVNVQHKVMDVLRQMQKHYSELFSITARREWTNTTAFGNVVVDGQVILEKVPVGLLLFLTKQLTDIKTMLAKVPTLDQSENWSFDNNSGLWKTEETKTHRNKKVQKGIVLYDATDKHPAQTQLITEDILAGYWNLVKMSGALPPTQRDEILAKLEKLIDAVKLAREEANSTKETSIPDVSAALFNYLGLN